MYTLLNDFSNSYDSLVILISSYIVLVRTLRLMHMRLTFSFSTYRRIIWFYGKTIFMVLKRLLQENMLAVDPSNCVKATGKIGILKMWKNVKRRKTLYWANVNEHHSFFHSFFFFNFWTHSRNKYTRVSFLLLFFLNNSLSFLNAALRFYIIRSV